jgi:hypothetical protein
MFISHRRQLASRPGDVKIGAKPLVSERKKRSTDAVDLHFFRVTANSVMLPTSKIITY